MSADMPAVALAPGLYRDVPEAVYASGPGWRDAMRASRLGAFLRSAAHGRAALDGPGRDSAALQLGRAVHAAALEPERWARDFVAMPKFKGRGAELQRLSWERIERQGRTPIPAAQVVRVRAMAEALRQHPEARRILFERYGIVEASIYWVDPVTTVPCKARIDRLTAECVPDLKTARDASEDAFRRDVRRFGYYDQAAWYLDGLDAIAPADRRWRWIVVESEPPHGVALYDADPVDLEQAARRNAEALWRYAEGLRTGEWPGYPTEPRVLSLPRWTRDRDLREEAGE